MRVRISIGWLVLLSSLSQAGDLLVQDQQGRQLTNESLAPMLAGTSEKRLRKLRETPEELRAYLSTAFAMQQVEEEAKQQSLLSDPEVEEQLRGARFQILLRALRDSEAQRVLSRIEPDIEALAQVEYDAYPEASYIRRKIRIAQIFIRKDPCHPEVAQQKAELLKQKLAEGVTDFTQLSKEFSDAPNAKQGGEIRKWFVAPPLDMLELPQPIGNEVPPEAKLAFGLLKPGEISQLLELPSGYLMVILLAQQPYRKSSFQEVRDSLVENVRARFLKQWQKRFNQSFYPSEEAKFDLNQANEMLRLRLLKGTSPVAGQLTAPK